MMVYLASDNELPLIAWNEKIPAFHVTELSAREDKVKVQFTLPSVYYVGAHEGCGCGFQAGEYLDTEFEDDKEEMQQQIDSLMKLRAYLKKQLAKGCQLEIFSCEDGDQAANRSDVRNIRTEEIGKRTFYFREKELLRVK